MADVFLEDDIVLEGDYSNEFEEGSDVEEKERDVRGGKKDQKTDDKAEGEAKASRKRPSVPKPKVTLDLIQGDKGLNSVFHSFPDAFRAGFRGKGHEVADLQRLLEMYSRWQQRIFPHCTFDEFIFKIEKLSSSRMLKYDLDTLRMKLLAILDPEGQNRDIEPRADSQGPMSQDDNADSAGYAPQGHAVGWIDRLARPEPTATIATAVGPIRPGAAAAQHAPPVPGMARSMLGQTRSPAAPRGANAPLPTHVAAPAVGHAEDEDFDDELVAMQGDVDWDEAMDVLDEFEDMIASPIPPPAPAAGRKPDSAAAAECTRDGVVAPAAAADEPQGPGTAAEGAADPPEQGQEEEEEEEILDEDEQGLLAMLQAGVEDSPPEPKTKTQSQARAPSGATQRQRQPATQGPDGEDGDGEISGLLARMYAGPATQGGDIELDDNLDDDMGDEANVSVGAGARRGTGGTQGAAGSQAAGRGTASQAQRARTVRALLDTDSD